MKAFMKTTKSLFGILAITAGFAMNGRSQVYQFTVPISGYITMSAQDLTTGSSGLFTNLFYSLEETVYLDTVSNTLRQVGTVYYEPSAPNIQFQETQGSASGTVTVNLGPTDGKLTFDSGLQSITWSDRLVSGSVSTYLPFPISISGSYSLVTGGQTYSNSFTYTTNDNYNDNYAAAYTFYNLSLSNYPASIQLSGLGECCYQGVMFPSPGIVADVRASNGFEMKLSPGIEPYWCCQNYAPGELFTWSSPPVTANLVTNSPPCIPYSAAATATVVDGFLVAATITDGGCGYTNVPRVAMLGGGGNGATGTAIVSNGVVTGITITDAGIDYTSTPTIYIYSPLGAQIALIQAVVPSFSDLLIGSNYQLQVSENLNSWTNQGAAFTATNPMMIYPGFFAVTNTNQVFFRLEGAP
jgi:hypothetical protein